jgi:hypothetical protein
MADGFQVLPSFDGVNRGLKVTWRIAQEGTEDRPVANGILLVVLDDGVRGRVDGFDEARLDHVTGIVRVAAPGSTGAARRDPPLIAGFMRSLFVVGIGPVVGVERIAWILEVIGISGLSAAVVDQRSRP